MDLSKFKTSTFNLKKVSEKHSRVTFGGTTNDDAGSLEAIWGEVKAQIVALPELSGLILSKNGNATKLVLESRTITATLNFVSQAPQI